MTTADKFNYIKHNYGDIPLGLISADTGISRKGITKIARRMGINVPTERLRALKMHCGSNPNPMTYTTYMLICRYFDEGSSISHIAYLLCRPRSVIENALRECRENGFYEKVRKMKCNS